MSSLSTGFLTLALLIALLSTFASSQTVCPSVSGNICNGNQSGTCIDYPSSNSYCACASGFGDLDCAVAVNESCPFNSVDSLSTSNIPIAVLATYTNDELTVRVLSPLVTERAYTTIAVDDSVSANENCTYPGSHWTHDFDGCADRFEGVMPWAETNSCGWVLDENDLEYYTYNSEMIIRHHDFIDPFDGRTGQEPVERVTQHVVPLQVQFPKYVDVSTEAIVQAPVSLLAAVSRQEIAANTSLAIIEVTTNLLFPYKLSAAELILVPSQYPGMNFTIEEVGAANLCTNVSDTTCTQVFRITIEIGDNCQISGSYEIEWDLGCQLQDQEVPESCAISGTPTATVQLSILSEDSCARISVQIEMDGTLASFDSDSYLSPKTQFIVNQTTYFRADLSSPDAALQSAIVRSVKLVSGGDPQIILYSSPSGANPAYGDADFQLDQNGADFAEFFFTLRESFIQGIAEDESKTYSVVARIDVTFTGVPGVKRLVLAGDLKSKGMTLQSSIGVSPLKEVFESSAASIGLAFTVALLGVALAFF